MFGKNIQLLLFCFSVKCHNCGAGSYAYTENSNGAQGIYRSRSVGAWRTAEEKYPHNVLIHRLTFKAYCGGSIIALSWILTAAQCESSEMDIYTGTAYIIGGGKYKPKKTYTHPEYNNGSVAPRNDFMLIELPEELYRTLYVKPIALAWSMLHIRPGKFGYLPQYGIPFGYSNYHFIQSFYIIREISSTIMDYKKCKDIFSSGGNQVADQQADQFCAGNLEEGKSMCNDEIGSGFMVYGALVGIASRSFGCARPNSPNVFAAIPAAREWICSIAGV